MLIDTFMRLILIESFTFLFDASEKVSLYLSAVVHSGRGANSAFLQYNRHRRNRIDFCQQVHLYGISPNPIDVADLNQIIASLLIVFSRG